MSKDSLADRSSDEVTRVTPKKSTPLLDAIAKSPNIPIPLSLELRQERENFRKEGNEGVAASTWKKGTLYAKIVQPGTFDTTQHWYQKCLNSNLHPIPKSFMALGNKRIASRYCHLHPGVDEKELLEVLGHENKIFRWAGADLFNVTNENGKRAMVVVECNSCPSGQKSFPFDEDEPERSGYFKLMSDSFMPLVKQEEEKGNLPKGGLAVIWDKNEMETSGYAAALADIADEPVFFAESYKDDPNPPVRWRRDRDKDGKPVGGRVLQVRTEDGNWHPIRAAFRYVTQAPWKRIPIVTETLIFNPILACLSGGRNKMVADRAYELFNLKNSGSGIKIRVPETIRNVTKTIIPMLVSSMGGYAVVKNPYSNAGQGVWTIACAEELDEFMSLPGHYDKYIVQALVGNSAWSSKTTTGTWYHVGTVPNKKMHSFVCDIRMMVCATRTGFKPLALYSRRAHSPLTSEIQKGKSWDVLGTNLSEKQEDGSLVSNEKRLLQCDTKDFNRLGIGLDDLIDGYVQTCCAAMAIDDIAKPLIRDEDGQRVFDAALFEGFCSDDVLLDELKNLSKQEIALDQELAMQKTTMDAMEEIEEVQGEAE